MTTTSKRTILARTIPAVLLAALLPRAACAQTASEWVLAAVPFSVSASYSAQEAAEKASAQLPQLILDYLEGRGGRVLEESEIEGQVLHRLKLERQELFGKLSDEIAYRDALLFSGESKLKQRQLAKESQKRAQDLQEKIELNLKKAADPLGLDPSAKKTLSSKPVYVSEIRPGDVVPIRLWRNSSAALFADKAAGESSAEFGNRVAASGVSAIVSGDIVERSGFMQLTVRLNLYPGGELLAASSDIGSLADLPAAAYAAAKALYPHVLNAKPVQLRFEISPPEAAAVARIYIDGAAPRSADDIEVQNGRHQVYIYAEGYESKEFSYSFTGTDEFIVQVRLPPKKRANVSLAAAGAEGRFYTNALPVEDNSSVALDSGTTIGEFVADSGINDFFVVDNRTARSDPAGGLVFRNITFQNSLKDFASEIEKSRRDLYNSYAALLFSLPLSFFANGMKVAAQNSYQYNRGTQAEAAQWKRYSLYSNIVTAGLGANFLVQLGRYLYRANTLLPQTITLEEDAPPKGGAKKTKKKGAEPASESSER